MTKFVGHDVARQFMNLVSERFLSADRVIQAAVKAGAVTLEEKIGVITIMRDSVRQVSLNHIFRSVQHRDEMFGAILEALSDLEDQLEDELSRQEEEKELNINTKED
jgi:type III secretion protein W